MDITKGRLHIDNLPRCKFCGGKPYIIGGTHEPCKIACENLYNDNDTINCPNEYGDNDRNSAVESWIENNTVKVGWQFGPPTTQGYFVVETEGAFGFCVVNSFQGWLSVEKWGLVHKSQNDGYIIKDQILRHIEIQMPV